jgi:error-prone DNA polymerase
MGFYPPSSLVRDAQRRGVEVRPPHVNRSIAECTIEDGAVRVGVGYVNAVGEEDARAIEAGRPYTDVGDLARRVDAKKDALEALVAAGACDEWGPRRQLLWRLGVTARGEAVGGGNRQLALPLEPTAEIPALPVQTPWEQMLADYKHTSLSVGVHPLELLRPHLPASVITSADLHETANNTNIELAGMAIARQRPATANGIVFMLLEDEHGQANLIIPPNVYEQHRAVIRGEPLLLARGKLERHDRNVNLLVVSVESLGPLARQAASEAEVTSALPRAHHFGHR